MPALKHPRGPVSDFLVQRIARPPRSRIVRVAIGIACGLVALGVRLALVPLLGQGTPFAAFLVGVVVASVFAGVSGGAAAVLTLAGAGPLLLLHDATIIEVRRAVAGEVVFIASAAAIIWVASLARTAFQREVAARDAEHLLRLELHHRVKNTLAVVQSLADQTFRGVRDPEAARRDFADRLAALAVAHDLLVDTGWRAVTLHDLADRALAPFRPPEPGRMVLEGAPAPVPPEAAVALTLCLHELATNAAKHGALSSPAGRVRLAWRIEDEAGRRRLHVTWTETGGPAPQAGRAGFGSRLLARALAGQPGAVSRLDFEPDGARWTAAFDLGG